MPSNNEYINDKYHGWVSESHPSRKWDQGQDWMTLMSQRLISQTSTELSNEFTISRQAALAFDYSHHPQFWLIFQDQSLITKHSIMMQQPSYISDEQMKTNLVNKPFSMTFPCIYGACIIKDLNSMKYMEMIMKFLVQS